MTIQNLSELEIDAVSGGNLIGSSIQFGSNLVSSFANTVVPIAKALSLIPGVGLIHQAGDAFVQQATDVTYNFGSSIGGTLPQVKMHFAEELADGTYNPLGVFKYFV